MKTQLSTSTARRMFVGLCLTAEELNTSTKSLIREILTDKTALNNYISDIEYDAKLVGEDFGVKYAEECKAQINELKNIFLNL